MHVHIRALEKVFLGRHDLSPPWLLLLCHTVPCTHYNDPDFESCVCVCATDTLEVVMAHNDYRHSRERKTTTIGYYFNYNRQSCNVMHCDVVLSNTV